jgi:hypothetical protein
MKALAEICERVGLFGHKSPSRSEGDLTEASLQMASIARPGAVVDVRDTVKSRLKHITGKGEI